MTAMILQAGSATGAGTRATTKMSNRARWWRRVALPMLLVAAALLHDVAQNDKLTSVVPSSLQLRTRSLTSSTATVVQLPVVHVESDTDERQEQPPQDAAVTKEIDSTATPTEVAATSSTDTATVDREESNDENKVSLLGAVSVHDGSDDHHSPKPESATNIGETATLMDPQEEKPTTPAEEQAPADVFTSNDASNDASQPTSGDDKTPTDAVGERETRAEETATTAPDTSNMADTSTNQSDNTDETSTAPQSANDPSRARQPTELSCDWKPNDDAPCVTRLTERIQSSLQNNIPLTHRRWIFLGDSTMSMLWKLSPLQNYLTKAAPVLESCRQKYECSTIRAGRCDTNEQLQIHRPSYWVPPNFTMGEGPLHHGLENHGCQDCYGCDTVLLSCANTESADAAAGVQPCTATDQSRGVYGGYVSVEFARDVEIQSDLFATTQENVVHYLERDWNTDLLKADFGQPICIVGTGFHDIVVPNVDLDTYLSNVQWYADLLSTVCDHIVWLSNTCPLTDEYRQTKVQTIEWNNAVRDLLKDYSDTKKISFIDVFEASVEYDHKDNIHMSPKWYELLGNMLLTVVRGGAMEPINDNSGSNTVSMKNR